MSTGENSVFISHAGDKKSVEIVEQIERSLQQRGIKTIRDQRDPRYKGSIKSFMERIGQGNYVIVVISEEYLRSPSCMFELVEIAENTHVHDRVFPIVLADAAIYNYVGRLEYVRYWEEIKNELGEMMRSIDPADLQSLRDNIDLIDRIRDHVSRLPSLLKDMNTLTPELHRGSEFDEIYAAIVRRRLGAPDSGSVQSGGTIDRDLPSGYEGSSRGPESQPSPEEPPKMGGASSAEEVAFTAYHPKEGKVETWLTLLVYTHSLSALDRVRNDAKRFEDEIKAPKETTSPASTRLLRGTEITIVPSCEGVVFNPERVSLKWIEDVQRAEFRFKADPSLAGDAAKGQITVYVGPLIIGTLKFAMSFGESDPSLILEQEVQSRMYQKDAIFISYSHKDTDVVLAFKKVHEATGHDVLIDIDDLRSGQEWNPELMRMIDRADIFQLFWSENSCQSRYCKEEWLHALKRNEEGFIRPVYWHLPLPQPPEKLSKYHFEYVNL